MVTTPTANREARSAERNGRGRREETRAYKVGESAGLALAWTVAASLGVCAVCGALCLARLTVRMLLGW